MKYIFTIFDYLFFRDLLVANTTQAEFKTVLEGICKQTKSFKSECLSIADQYYDVIYEKLTTDLDPNGACFLIGICPKGLGQESEQSVIVVICKSFFKFHTYKNMYFFSGTIYATLAEHKFTFD